MRTPSGRVGGIIIIVPIAYASGRVLGLLITIMGCATGHSALIRSAQFILIDDYPEGVWQEKLGIKVNHCPLPLKQSCSWSGDWSEEGLEARPQCRLSSLQ